MTPRGTDRFPYVSKRASPFVNNCSPNQNVIDDRERDCPRARLPTLKWFMAVAAVVVKNVVKQLEWSSRLQVYRIVSRTSVLFISAAVLDRDRWLGLY